MIGLLAAMGRHDRRMRGLASWRSRSSVGSALSAYSLLSIGSLLSVFSVLSIGCAGSILSIGSAGSIFSIGGAGRYRSRSI